jgi:hypothetical protein
MNGPLRCPAKPAKILLLFYLPFYSAKVSKMTIEHLKILETLFERNYWTVDRRAPGDDFSISEIWHLRRPKGTGTLTVEFDGLDDMVCIPVEKSYGCNVVEIPKSGLYFSKIRHALWPKKIAEFERLIKEFNRKEGW